MFVLRIFNASILHNGIWPSRNRRFSFNKYPSIWHCCRNLLLFYLLHFILLIWRIHFEIIAALEKLPTLQLNHQKQLNFWREKKILAHVFCLSEDVCLKLGNSSFITKFCLFRFFVGKFYFEKIFHGFPIEIVLRFESDDFESKCS